MLYNVLHFTLVHYKCKVRFTAILTLLDQRYYQVRSFFTKDQRRIMLVWEGIKLILLNSTYNVKEFIAVVWRQTITILKVFVSTRKEFPRPPFGQGFLYMYLNTHPYTLISFSCRFQGLIAPCHASLFKGSSMYESDKDVFCRFSLSPSISVRKRL